MYFFRKGKKVIEPKFTKAKSDKKYPLTIEEGDQAILELNKLSKFIGEAKDYLAGTKIFYGVAHTKLGMAYRNKLKADATFYTAKNYVKKADGSYKQAVKLVKKLKEKYGA